MSQTLDANFHMYEIWNLHYIIHDCLDSDIRNLDFMFITYQIHCPDF